MITRRFAMNIACMLVALTTIAPAQEDLEAEKKAITDISAPQPETTAPQLVREGNELLLDDKASLALEKYDQAKTLAPEAREIAFAEGLSHFKLGDYDLAREQFAQVAGSAGDGLADDALYSQGTCDHAEALANTQEPQQSIGNLEKAMRTYRDVLARDPNHKAARDAYFKAASMRRQMKQQMQEQEKQQQGDSDEENEDQDDQEKQDQQEQSDKESDEENEQQDSDNKDSEDQKSSESEQNEKEKKQEQSESDEQKESQQQQQAQQSQEEQVSKEQAERKLREMLEELKDRQKARKKPVKGVPTPRGGKDW